MARKVKALDAHAAGEVELVSIGKIGPDLVFGRLWQATGFSEILRGLAAQRKYGFDLERAVYLSVLHRLFLNGSDRTAEVWKGKLPHRGSAEHHAAPALSDHGLVGESKSGKL